jgi:cephalosporin-C deacetylase-like acetyl esterase
VDPSRIVLTGSSLGGELVIRAAAFEHRLAAVVADPGFLSLWLSWQKLEPKITSLFAGGATKAQVNAVWEKDFIPALNAGAAAVERFNLMKAAEGYASEIMLAARKGQVFTDLYGLGSALMQFTVADVAHRVTAPTLVTAYEGDQLVVPASGQGTEVYQRLTTDKQFHQFTAAEGAQGHCGPMAPQTRNQVVYDWLDGIL